MELNTFKTLSDGERMIFADELKKTRKVHTCPDPLQLFAMKSVLLNHKSLIYQYENPLRFLPNTIVQEFLKLILSTRTSKVPLVPSEVEKDVVELLLNPQVTEFDCGHNAFETDLFIDHLVENCPKIREITLFGGSGFDQRVSIVPFYEISAWSNLKQLYLSGFHMTDRALKIIQEHNPQLEKMRFTFSAKKFTSVGREVLTKMLCLKCLHVTIDEYKRSNETTLTLVHIAGKVPNLQRYQYSACISNENFVECYGRLYPGKKLTIDHLSLLDSNFKCKWPSCLAVNKLSLNFDNDSEEGIENICSISCPVMDITFNKPCLPYAYKIVERLGSNIVRLVFHGLTSKNYEYLDFHLLLTSCPMLERFCMLCDLNLRVKNLSKLSPNHFRSLKSFIYEDSNAGSAATAELNKVYNLYFIGSEENQTLTVPFRQLKAASEFFQVHPGSWNSLQSLLVTYRGSDGLEMVLELVLLLIQRAPFLEEICISSNIEDFKDIRLKYEWLHSFFRRVGIRLMFA